MNISQANDEKYMRRALQLARGGWEYASPNPMVGAVVVHRGHIIGEGFHRHYGGSHAEVNAIQSVIGFCHGNERQADALLRQSTIYVTLEPCAHYGKTPPCAKLIINKRIPRVVVGCRDPFAKVDGLGIKMLQDAGCDVSVGVLEKECIALNRRFMTFHSEHRPFVTLKWAESADGFIDKNRNIGDKQQPVKFSTEITTQVCHRRRAEHDAILIGWRTALLDNPTLTARLWPGRNPLRIIVGRRGELPGHLNVLSDNSAETIVMDTDVPNDVLNRLYSRGVQSVLIEGGARTLQSFIYAGMYDEVCIERSHVYIGNGVKSPKLPNL